MSTEPQPSGSPGPAVADTPLPDDKPPVAAPVSAAATPATPVTTPAGPSIEDMLGQSAEPAQAGGLNPHQAIQFNDAEGKVVTATLGQLVERFQKPDGLEPSDAQLLEAVKGAMAGDTNAIQQLVAMQTAAPAAPATGQEAIAGSPADGNRVQELQQQVDALNQRVAQQTPLLGQIDMARRLQLVRTLAEQCKGHLPFIGQHPEGPQMVLGTIQQLEQVATQQGINPQAPEVRRQLVLQAFNAVEGQLRNTHHAFRGWTPPDPGTESTAPASPEVTMVDDQARPGPRTVAAGLRLIGGQLVNPQGQVVDRTGQPLPSQPPEMAPVGGSPSAAPPQPAGPTTLKDVKKGMATRAQELQELLP